VAVAVVMDWDEGSLDQYDEVIGKMGFDRNGTGPVGSKSHWVAKNGDGIRVVDVWESREQFDAFAQDQIGPLTAEAGLSEPKMEFFEVHNTLSAP
jgi:hypothetical protein